MALENQVVVVTGCSTGIGRALVQAVSEAGHHVFATARRLESIADLSRDGVETLRLDVNDPGTIEGAVAAVLARKGRIDVLVNNAGVNVFGPITEIPLGRIRQAFETNVLGLLATTQAVFPHMADRKSGRIVNIGSVVGLLPTPFAAAYCATKSAVHMLSEAMRMEVKPFGIDVVVVQPGGVKSSIADSGSLDIERYERETSRYHRVYDGIQKRANASQDSPMPSEEFARQVVAEAFATPAPRVVRAGTNSDLVPRLAEMPGEQRDAMVSANYGLDRFTP